MLNVRAEGDWWTDWRKLYSKRICILILTDEDFFKQKGEWGKLHAKEGLEAKGMILFSQCGWCLGYVRGNGRKYSCDGNTVSDILKAERIWTSLYKMCGGNKGFSVYFKDSSEVVRFSLLKIIFSSCAEGNELEKD